MVAFVAPGHYLNQWWLNVCRVIGNIFQLILNQTKTVFIQETVFVNAVCKMADISSWPQCVKYLILFGKHSLLTGRHVPRSSSCSQKKRIQPHSIFCDASTNYAWHNIERRSSKSIFTLPFSLSRNMISTIVTIQAICKIVVLMFEFRYHYLWSLHFRGSIHCLICLTLVRWCVNLALLLISMQCILLYTKLVRN